LSPMTLSIQQRAHTFANIEALGGRLQHHVYIETMGCQMNVYDTERMLEVLATDGYSQTDEVERADLILLNTCSIRDKVEHKVLSRLGVLRELKDHNPDLLLGVTGCVAQQEGDKLLRKVPYLDLVLGPDQIPSLAQKVRTIRADQQRLAATEFVSRKQYDFPIAQSPSDGRVTSFVTIMKGCNKVCTYCIVPFTRGREVSKPSAQVLAEVRMLVDQGVREVTLLGQNVNSYGKDQASELDFADLLAAVNEALSTDIIVGFPGETAADFQLTLNLLAHVKYASIYSFIYSARPGTRAADLADDVTLPEKKHRLVALQLLQDDVSRVWMETFRNREVELLFEGPARSHFAGAHSALAQHHEGAPQMMGRTPENVKVNVDIGLATDMAAWKGRLAKVRIDRVNPHSLQGTLLSLV